MPTTTDLRKLVDQIAQLTKDRDDMIRTLLAGESRPVDIARAAKLSSGRIYQIKARRR
jgi:hypothetical protein